MRKTSILLLAACLLAACGRSSKPEGPSGAAAAGDSASAAQQSGRGGSDPDRKAAARGVMQDEDLTRTVEELRRDSLNLRRIDSLALCDQPSYATPREAVAAQMRAYVAVDAPLMFHVCELGFGRPEAQHVLDYQHMMEGLARRGLLPTAFTITRVGEEGDVCSVDVDLTMPDGSIQPMLAEAFRLPDGRWRPLVK